MEQFFIPTDDGAKLSVQTYDIEVPTAVIQIVHGMEEHQERYAELAGFLNGCGYSVVTSDLRGHGKTAEKLGHIKDKEGYLALVDDQKRIREFIEERYASSPVYLLAHSMGTIICRILLQTHSLSYDKAVLLGYPHYRKLVRLVLPVVGAVKLCRGASYKSKAIQNMSVGGYSKSVPSPATKYDWLTTDQSIVQKYINDPYCGKGFTCGAFSDLYHLLIQMHKPSAYIDVNKQLDILMLRGTDDPCTGGDKGAADSVAVLKKAGFTQITTRVYPAMRHELLNEKERNKIYADIAVFFAE